MTDFSDFTIEQLKTEANGTSRGSGLTEDRWAQDYAEVTGLIRRNLINYEEAGNVLASTFRRLDCLATTYGDPASSTFLIARDVNADGLVVGGAGLGPLHGLSPLDGMGEVRDLVVDREYRGRGIGAKLLKRCVEQARFFGYQRLYLETTPQMEKAQKLFVRFGFRPITHAQGHGVPIDAQGDIPCYFILDDLSD